MARYSLYEPKSVASPTPSVFPATASLLLTMLGAPLYLWLFDIPLIRSSGLPAFLLMGAGVGYSVWLARGEKRNWVRSIAGVNTTLLAVFMFVFFWLWALPRPAEAATALAVAPDFKLKDDRNRTLSLSDTLANGPVLLVFFRGHWCLGCMSELRGLATVQDELKTLGVRIVCVTVDTPAHSAEVVERFGLKFPITSDNTREVIAKYGVVHIGGAPDGTDISLPANFLIDRNGKILWRRVAQSVQDRPDPRVVLQTARELLAKSGR